MDTAAVCGVRAPRQDPSPRIRTPISERRMIGFGCMNLPQRDLIIDALNEAVAQDFDFAEETERLFDEASREEATPDTIQKGQVIEPEG